MLLWAKIAILPLWCINKIVFKELPESKIKGANTYSLFFMNFVGAFWTRTCRGWATPYTLVTAMPMTMKLKWTVGTRTVAATTTEFTMFFIVYVFMLFAGTFTARAITSAIAIPAFSCHILSPW